MKFLGCMPARSDKKASGVVSWAASRKGKVSRRGWEMGARYGVSGKTLEPCAHFPAPAILAAGSHELLQIAEGWPGTS